MAVIRNLVVKIGADISGLSKGLKTAQQKLEKVSNIYLLGRKKYEELPSYAHRFTVATIPFQINEMMDCVSPIKFYEYCAYGLPTISSYMPEMAKCECDFVACYHSKEEYVSLIKQYIKPEILEKARKHAPEIAINNTWHARVKRMEDVLL